MKKLILGLIFLVSAGSAIAGPGHHYYRPHHGHGHWVAPLVLGGVLGAVIVSQYQTPPPVVTNSLPPPPFGYHYVQLFDYNCNCYKWALMPNN